MVLFLFFSYCVPKQTTNISSSYSQKILRRNTFDKRQKPGSLRNQFKMSDKVNNIQATSGQCFDVEINLDQFTDKIVNEQPALLELRTFQNRKLQNNTWVKYHNKKIIGFPMNGNEGKKLFFLVPKPRYQGKIKTYAVKIHVQKQKMVFLHEIRFTIGSFIFKLLNLDFRVKFVEHLTKYLRSVKVSLKSKNIWIKSINSNEGTLTWVYATEERLCDRVIMNVLPHNLILRGYPHPNLQRYFHKFLRIEKVEYDLILPCQYSKTSETNKKDKSYWGPIAISISGVFLVSPLIIAFFIRRHYRAHPPTYDKFAETYAKDDDKCNKQFPQKITNCEYVTQKKPSKRLNATDDDSLIRLTPGRNHISTQEQETYNEINVQTNTATNFINQCRLHLRKFGIGSNRSGSCKLGQHRRSFAHEKKNSTSYYKVSRSTSLHDFNFLTSQCQVFSNDRNDTKSKQIRSPIIYQGHDFLNDKLKRQRYSMPASTKKIPNEKEIVPADNSVKRHLSVPGAYFPKSNRFSLREDYSKFKRKESLAIPSLKANDVHNCTRIRRQSPYKQFEKINYKTNEHYLQNLPIMSNENQDIIYNPNQNGKFSKFTNFQK